MRSSSGSAPTIQLSGDTGSAYDSNGVLSAFSINSGNGASFSKSGNTLNITKTGNISESTVFSAVRYLPSASNSSYNIWYMSGSTYQTTISLYNAGTSGLYGYFKIKAPSLGSISLTKTTEDGKNLSGWRFGIYSNAACTNLVSGPYTTNSSGKLSVTGLNAGVTFTNTHYWRIQFQKTTNTGNHLEGWTFRVMDSTRKIVGDYTTDETGYAITGNLPLGHYTVVELPTEDT